MSLVTTPFFFTMDERRLRGVPIDLRVASDVREFEKKLRLCLESLEAADRFRQVADEIESLGGDLRRTDVWFFDERRRLP